MAALKSSLGVPTTIDEGNRAPRAHKPSKDRVTCTDGNSSSDKGKSATAIN